MTGSVTTAMCTSFKGEMPQALHCFNGSISPTGSCASGANHVTGLSSLAGITVGMLAVNANLPSPSYVSYIDSTTSLYLSGATGAVSNATGTITSSAITFTADIYKMALIVASPAGTYGAATTNYSSLTTDEVASGGGYTTGGFAWTAAQNITPTTSGTGAYWQWTTNPSWTSATFSTSGALVYNGTSYRNGASGRSVATYSFGGTQTVTSGTFTVIQPTNGVGTSMLQVN